MKKWKKLKSQLPLSGVSETRLEPTQLKTAIRIHQQSPFEPKKLKMSGMFALLSDDSEPNTPCCESTNDGTTDYVAIFTAWREADAIMSRMYAGTISWADACDAECGVLPICEAGFQLAKVGRRARQHVTEAAAEPVIVPRPAVATATAAAASTAARNTSLFGGGAPAGGGATRALTR